MPQLVNNPWVGYINRSYSSIKASLLSKLGPGTDVPEITDHSESNILIIILSMFAGMMEQMHYYLDNLAREAFLMNARRYSSVLSLSKLVDYRVKAKVPASADLVLTLKDTNGDPINLPADYTIPQGTVFLTQSNIRFRTVRAFILKAGKSIHRISVVQITGVATTTIGTTTSDPNQIFLLPEDYAHRSSIITINGENWIERTTLGRSGPYDKHYIADGNVNREMYIKFGDDTNGAKPTSGQEINLEYNTTLGFAGNTAADTITIPATPIVIPGVSSVKVTNPIKASGGYDIEDIDKLRTTIPLYLRTLERAVSDRDHIDVAKLAPGVTKADKKFDCGKWVDIYIGPEDGGIASIALCESTYQFMKIRKMTTIFLRVLPAGETYWVLEFNVVAMPYVQANIANDSIVNDLLETFDYYASDVNKAVRLSDIYYVIDNNDKVDYANLVTIKTIPYARPSYSLNQLVWERETMPGSSEIINWRIAYDGVYYRLFKSNIFMVNLTPEVWYTDPLNIIKLKISEADYLVGDEWIFKTYPVNQDIVFDDFTVPVLLLDNITLNVTEQTIIVE